MSRDLNHTFASLVADPHPDIRSSSPVVRSSVRYEVVSTIRKQVFWRNALGLTATESPSTPGAGNVEGFFVTVEYEFHGGIAFDIREFIDELTLPEGSAIKKEILQRIQGVNNHKQFVGANTRTFKYTVGITRDQLEQAGGVVYLRDLDLVVGYEAYRETALHPYSQPAMREQLREQINFNEVGNNHRLLWVDNTHQLDSMWYNNGLGVFEIRPVASPHHKDGFYLFTQCGKQSKEDCKYLPIAEAVSQFLLHRTRADAEVHGKPDKAFAAVITEKEQELSLLNMDLKRQKADLDREAHLLKVEKDRHEQQVKDADHQRKRDQEEFDNLFKKQREEGERQSQLIKMERDRQEWERSSYSKRMDFDHDMEARIRKERSENTKYIMDTGKVILGIISVALSIYAVIQKSKKD